MKQLLNVGWWRLTVVIGADEGGGGVLQERADQRRVDRHETGVTETPADPRTAWGD